MKQTYYNKNYLISKYNDWIFIFNLMNEDKIEDIEYLLNYSGIKLGLDNEEYYGLISPVIMVKNFD